jgi:hypothetical protein
MQKHKKKLSDKGREAIKCNRMYYEFESIVINTQAWQQAR